MPEGIGYTKEELDELKELETFRGMKQGSLPNVTIISIKKAKDSKKKKELKRRALEKKIRLL